MSYAVQFIADDLSVAFVVVSVCHCELQRPEEGVVHLHTRAHTHTNEKSQHIWIKH